MQASKAADTYGLFEGHSIQQADARQAYTQSKLGGTPAWFSRIETNGLKHGPTCVILYARCIFHCAGTLIQVDIGSSIVIDMLRQKLSGPADKLAEGWKLSQ
eukprot:5049201-Pyramimonas_sp.AAC.1